MTKTNNLKRSCKMGKAIRIACRLL